MVVGGCVERQEHLDGVRLRSARICREPHATTRVVEDLDVELLRVVGLLVEEERCKRGRRIGDLHPCSERPVGVDARRADLAAVELAARKLHAEKAVRDRDVGGIDGSVAEWTAALRPLT